MSSFGGSIKLTGEEEYRRALKNITTGLREVSSQLSLTTTQFQNSDKSTESLKKAQQDLAKIYDQQKAKVEQLRSAYESFKSKVEVQAQAHQKLVAEYNKEKAELERLEKTVGTTSKEYQDQKSKVEDLAKKVATSTKNYDDNQNALSKMGTELNKAEKDLSNTAKQMDELGKETKETEKEVKGAGDGFTVFKGVLADLTSKAIQSALNGLKQLGSALIDVGKQAITSYADYEQLAGGVETLFKDSADVVKNYSQQAYKTAGMSANEYMETITSFSASLIQGLGGDTKKASEIGNMAIIDMSDNANKMGTDISMIQNAYQGFAKDNFTMLDNLKLGFGGTAGEMARLINETGVMGKSFKATAKNVKDVPFDKMVEAIHKVQEQMGITGTTSLEASQTISGSVNSMKASWQNLLTGIADSNQEVGPLVDQFVDSVATSWENIKPRIRQTIDGIKEMIATIFEKLPEIAEDIPELKPLVTALQFIVDNGPVIISTLAGIVAGITAFKVAGMITTLITGFQTFFATIQAGQGIMAALNVVMAANPFGLIAFAIAGLVTAFITLWNTSEEFRNFWIGLWENIKSVVSTAIETITGVFNTVVDFIKNNWQSLLLLLVNPFWGAFNLLYDNCEGFRNFIDGFVQNIKDFFMQIPEKVGEMKDKVVTFFQELPYNIGLAIGELIGNVINGFNSIKDFIMITVPEIINNIVTFFSELPSKIWTWLSNAYQRVSSWGESVKSKAIEVGTNFLNNVINFFKELPSKIWNWLSNAIDKVRQFGSNMTEKAKEGARNTLNAVVNGLQELPNRVANIGRNIVEGLWNGIKNAGGWINDKVGEFARGILDGMKNALGIQSPSKVFADVVGKNIALGIGEGFTDEMKNVSAEMEGAIPTNFDTGVTLNGTSASLSNYASDYSYNRIVEAFQDALSSMKIELDDEEAGRFVRRTVETAIYT